LKKPKSFTAYMNTSRVLWYWITITVALIAAINIYVFPEGLQPFRLLRIILGALFVLWLPGYSSVKALFPSEVSKQSSTHFDAIERIALSIAMSIAIVIIVGLFLSHTPWGISLDPIVLCLVALTIVLATFAVVRDYYLQEKSQNKILSKLFSRYSLFYSLRLKSLSKFSLKNRARLKRREKKSVRKGIRTGNSEKHSKEKEARAKGQQRGYFDCQKAAVVK
jgi:hypothetical protein